MTLKTVIASIAVLLSATTVSLAQSLPRATVLANRPAALSLPGAVIVPMRISKGCIIGAIATGITRSRTNKSSSDDVAVENNRWRSACSRKLYCGAASA